MSGQNTVPVEQQPFFRNLAETLQSMGPEKARETYRGLAETLLHSIAETLALEDWPVEAVACTVRSLRQARNYCLGQEQVYANK